MNYFGFNAGVVDGQIGAGTRGAIERFQAAAGYPVNGRNLTTDQLAFLTGGYTWATTQGGAMQTGMSGQVLLTSGYRNFLNGGLTVQPPVVAAPVAPAAPRVATPTVAAPPVIARPPVVLPRSPGRGGVRSTSLNCPTPQNSDGFQMAYDGYSVEYFVDDDGSTGAWFTTADRSFAYDTYYHPLGLMLETWNSDPQGNEVPGTRETVEYVGVPAQLPEPAVGVSWSGMETATYSDGTTSRFATTSTVLSAQTVPVAGCPSFNIMGIQVDRTNLTDNTSYQESYTYFVDFGVVVFGGAQYAGQPFEGVEPTGIEIRADDGVGP